MAKTYTVPKSESWKMFDDISPKYDFLNHFLSFGLDIHWRKRLASFAPKKDQLKVLDLATGTADVLISLTESLPVEAGMGIDMAEKMLEIGRKKIIARNLGDKLKLQSADANKVPFADNTFDCATIAFGIRNMEYPTRVLNEMRRVLKPGGRALILEFSLPEQAILRWGHLTYLRYGVPLLGAIVSGHYKAYKYLNQTIEDFPYGRQFCELMTASGFTHVKSNPLLCGVASIYQGEKP